jgi:hypothetical protein
LIAGSDIEASYYPRYPPLSCVHKYDFEYSD